MKLAFKTLPELAKYIAPSPSTIKRWVQKLGYYKLTRTKIVANDWMVLIDATIQMGPLKCLLVVGCRKIDWLKKKGALTLSDLELLGLHIVSNLNHCVITQMLHEVASSVGTIISICSDGGPEMIRGIKDFRLNNPKSRYIRDTAHRIANFLEGILEKDSKWQAFRNELTQTRRKMQNSKVAGALPPSPRTKARFMNVGAFILWAEDQLVLLDYGISTPELDINELRKYVGWLLDYREEILYWSRLIKIGTIVRQLIRDEGIHMNIVDNFELAISSIPMGYKELHFANHISMFLLRESEGLKPEDAYMATTEPLESLFGKLKYMEREQTGFGFTSLVLAAMACVGPTDDKTIAEAINNVKISDIEKWKEKEIGKSIQSQRRSINKMIKGLMSKMERKNSGILEGEAMGF